jgi:2-oxoglutarate ferredoxin oxidoreductase subunit beta
MDVNIFATDYEITWCPGCGNFGIWMALRNALIKMNLRPDDVFLTYGIGCHGNMSNWLKSYAFEGLHGRGLPIAQGTKLANHRLPVISIHGDGDGLGEGGNHFIHAAKRNPDITMIIHDNQLYSLTTGQASPVAKPGFKTKSTPQGVTDEPMNPLVLGIVSGATFVARSFSGDSAHLTEMIVAAVSHQGFSVIDVLQPCVTFDKVHTYAWYRERVYKLAGTGYTPDDRLKAIEKAYEWEQRIPIGIFYQVRRPTLESLEPSLKDQTLVDLGVSYDLEAMLSEFA